MTSRLRVSLAAAAAATVALFAAGCGVGSTDEGKISETVTDYLTALAVGDYGAACEQLAGTAKPEGDCPARVEASIAGVSPGEFSDDAEGRSEIDVDGDAATVTLESGTTLELARVRGAWLVSSPYTG
jgi:hypothetical protein